MDGGVSLRQNDGLAIRTSFYRAKVALARNHALRDTHRLLFTAEAATVTTTG